MLGFNFHTLISISHQDIWIYESNIFLTTSPTSDRGKWIPQTTHLHRLAVPLEDVVTNRGQLTSEQNIDVSVINLKLFNLQMLFSNTNNK